jgi:hypothetical protein
MTLSRKLQSMAYRFLISSRLLRIFSYCFYKLFGKVLWVTAMTGQGSNVCLKNGFLPVPVHFYSPIPDIADLERRRIWDVKSSLAGINFAVEGQLRLLKELARGFSDECAWPLKPTANPADFYLENSSFSYGCAASTHCMIRRFRPANLIEIGSGMSSRVISRALGLNSAENGSKANYSIVDPYPGDVITAGSLNITELVNNKVELLDPSFFDRLQPNDILFIDSGHCARIGGDVNYLFLEILPRLKQGVIIHVHDISLPYEYSKAYSVNETFRQFWTEQYLLQSFLCFNGEYEVLLAMNYLMTDHFELFKASFPHYDPKLNPNFSGSFWMRRKL